MIGSPRLPVLGLLLTATLLAPITRADEPPAAEPPPPSSPAETGAAAPVPPPLTDELDRLIHVPAHPRTTEDIDRLDALRYYTAARALEAQRNWTEAIDLLEKAQEKAPDSVAILRRLSRLYFGLGRIEPAVETSRQVIAADPQDAETIRRLVRYYRQSNQLDAAEELLREVLQNPELPEFCPARLVVLHDLGMLYYDNQQNAQAVEPLAELVRLLDSKAATDLTLGDQQLILGDDEADAYRKFGEAFFEAGRFDLAILALRRSLTYDPESPQTPLYLAQALLRNGQAKQALEVLEPIIADKPPGRVAFDVLAQVLTALGREDEIVPRLEAAAKADPDNALLRYALADRYEQSGRVEAARALYRELITEQPDPQGFAALARSLREENKLSDLLQLFETARSQRAGRGAIEPQIRLIGTDPELADAILDVGLEMLRADPPKLGPAGREILAEIAADADRTEKLIALDRLSVERNPSPQSYYELADTLQSAGRSAEAAETIQEMMDRFPQFAGDTSLLTKLASLQFEAGLIEQALANGRKVLEVEPNDLIAHEIVGFALSRLNRHDEAIALYKQISERFAGNAEAVRLGRIWLANAYVNAGQFEQGEAELLALLEENPDDPWINNDLGYLWADRGMHLERAEAMIRKAVAAEPENSAYLDSLGWVLYQQGELDEAITYLEKAVAIRPSATNLDHLGDAYYRRGNDDDARRAWERAVSMAEEAEPPDPILADLREKLDALGDRGRPPDPASANP